IRRERRDGRKTWTWLAAGVALVGIGAFAQSSGSGGDGADAGRVIWPQPAASIAQPAESVSAAVTPISITTTVGGYTYDWTARQAAINADSEVPNGYFIVGNATDPDYLFAHEKGVSGSTG